MINLCRNERHYVPAIFSKQYLNTWTRLVIAWKMQYQEVISTWPNSWVSPGKSFSWTNIIYDPSQPFNLKYLEILNFMFYIIDTESDVNFFFFGIDWANFGWYNILALLIWMLYETIFPQAHTTYLHFELNIVFFTS